MKLSVPRDSLSGALQLVGRAVSTRGTLPSLGGILADRRRGHPDPARHRHGARPDQHARAAKVEQDGTVLLPGRLFADVVRSLPPGEVTLELRGEQRDVEIAAGGARFHLRTLPAEDFPRLPEVEGETVRLPARRWPRRSSSSPAPRRATRCGRSSPASCCRPRAPS